MKINTPLELDFTQEARNAVKVTPRVLVMYYCTGCQINDVQSVRRQNVDVYDVSNKIGQMYSKMIFDDGYVHCDPHPGNVLVSR